MGAMLRVLPPLCREHPNTNNFIKAPICQNALHRPPHRSPRNPLAGTKKRPRPKPGPILDVRWSQEIGQ